MIRKYAEIFCWKNVSSFCNAKATHIFSAKNIRILYIESTRAVNKMTLNKLIKLMMLWTTGPWCFMFLSTWSHIPRWYNGDNEGLWAMKCHMSWTPQSGAQMLLEHFLDGDRQYIYFIFYSVFHSVHLIWYKIFIEDFPAIVTPAALKFYTCRGYTITSLWLCCWHPKQKLC